ncbi:MAG: adenosylmethionine--8-amino-7-oxononanoate transaminase [Ginsengibacter sp.]
MNLTEKDLEYIWHPYTHQFNMPEPILITKGKGANIFDENNNKYIDAISSWWVNIHGHGNKYIAKQIFKQAKKLEHVIFAGFTHEPAIRLAEKLLELLQFNFSKIFYSDNGSTAVEVAIKMALQYWSNIGAPAKNKILAFNNSYHGDTFGAMSAGSRSVFNKAFNEKLFDVVFIDIPTADNLAEIDSILTQHPDIGIFIYEPLLQGAGGMQMYDAKYLTELLHLLKGKNIICIADEVLTGFYRTGSLFASDVVYIKPDIICLSKALTGGTMALGVTACTQVVHAAFIDSDKTKTFYHGHSFTANPLACITALSSIKLLSKPKFIDKVHSLVSLVNEFRSSLLQKQEIFKKTIKNVRQCGTIVAFEVVGQDSDGYNNTITNDFKKFCLDNGVFLRPLGNTIYIMPPYCIKKKELRKVFRIVEQYLDK